MVLFRYRQKLVPYRVAANSLDGLLVKTDRHRLFRALLEARGILLFLKLQLWGRSSRCLNLLRRSTLTTVAWSWVKLLSFLRFPTVT